MSLINQMLKDLEDRSKTAIDPEVALSGLSSVVPKELAFFSRKKYFFISFFLFILLSVFCLKQANFYKKNHYTLNHSNVNATAKTQIDTQIPLQDEAAQVAMVPSALMGIAMQAQSDVTNLRFLLNQDTLYEVNMDEVHHQVTLIFDKTNLVADLPPLNYLKSAISNIEMSNTNDGDLKVTITLNAGAQIQHLDWVTENKSPELQVDFLYNIPSVPSVPVHAASTPLASLSIKKPVLAFNAEQQYRRALEFLKGDQSEQAIQILSSVLNDFPQFYSARQTLVSLLLQRGDKEKAEKMLAVGLQQSPNFPGFIQLKARLLVNENKIDQALRLLQDATPNFKENPDYYAFIAALYQRTDQTQQAEKLYEQLLRLQPYNASWWAGLGIALESLGRKNESKEAYLRAERNDGLTPELQVFVEGRLNEA